MKELLKKHMAIKGLYLYRGGFMKILRIYIKENLGILMVAIIFLIFNTLATLAIPFQISNMINNGIMQKILKKYIR